MKGLYQIANNSLYSGIQALSTFTGQSVTPAQISNELFPQFLNGLTAQITNMNPGSRGFELFRIPVPIYGRLIEQVGAVIHQPMDLPGYAAGTDTNPFVRTPQNLIANYVNAVFESSYRMEIDQVRVEELLSAGNDAGVAALYANAFNNLYRSIEVAHDLQVTALVGWLAAQQASSLIEIPAIPDSTATPEDRMAWANEVWSVLEAVVKQMTMYPTSSFNLMGADVAASRDDLIFVGFVDIFNVGQVNAINVLKSIIATSAGSGVSSNGTGGFSSDLGDYIASMLGINNYVEMNLPGIETSTIARANGIANLPGLQTADTTTGTITQPNANLQFGILQAGAVNVGLKHMLSRVNPNGWTATDFHFVRYITQAWAAGPFQSAFFGTAPTPVTPGA